MEKYNKYKVWIPAGILSFTLVFFGIFTSGFFTFANMAQVFSTVSFVGLPSVGLAIVMVTGLFDLSFVGVIGVSSVIIIRLLSVGYSLGAVLAASLAATLLMELLNAFVIVKLKVHPWLTTISTMLIYLGLEQAISRGEYLALNHPFFDWIRFGRVFSHIPIIVVCLFAVIAVFYIVMHKIPSGTYLYAVGGNAEASRKIGLNVGLLQSMAYAIMGLLCWITSLIYVAQLSGYPPESAYINQLTVILSVFFGMAISPKGVVNILGACIGAAFTGLLSNGLALMAVSSYWIKLIEGCFVIVIIIGNSIGKGGVVSYE